MKKLQIARKPVLFLLASLLTVVSLVAMPSIAFARKVGPGRYVVVTNPLTITLNCDETSWNPTCSTTTVSNLGLKTYSYFYIDGRIRGYGDVNIKTVCSVFRLRDGWHTARLFARDSQHNWASIGPYPLIHCDRTGPYVYTGVHYYRGIVVANPYAFDRWSGVNSSTETFSVDSTAVAIHPYWNVCQLLNLGRGWHVAVVTAADNAGNTSARAGWFYCR